MKTFPAGLDVLLRTGNYASVDLYDFTLKWDSSHLYYTTADRDVVYAGHTYTSKGPYFDLVGSAARWHAKAGLDLDTWSIQISPTQLDPITGAAFPAKIYSQPWLTAVRVGALDGAQVNIHRLYVATPLPTFAAPLQATSGFVLQNLFVGRVGQIEIGRTSAMISINSWVEVLQRAMPRNVFGAVCRHTLFDVGCTLVRANFAVSGAVTAVTDDGNFATNLSNVNDYFSLGVLQWVTGSNAPMSFAVRKHTMPGAAITLIQPAPYAVQVGDTFTAYPGCDKTTATCQNKFNNLVNHGGQIGIPAPEMAI